MTNTRYHSIALEPDDMGRPREYTLKFSTMPGMSTSVGELRDGDLDALADILRERADLGGEGPIIRVREEQT
jgi:hypothetical protein